MVTGTPTTIREARHGVLGLSRTVSFQCAASARTTSLVAHLGERLANVELRGRPQTRAVRSAPVIEVSAGRDVGEPVPLRETAHRGEHSLLAEVAAIAGIGPIARVGELVGAQHHQFRPDLTGETPSGHQLGARQAGESAMAACTASAPSARTAATNTTAESTPPKKATTSPSSRPSRSSKAAATGGVRKVSAVCTVDDPRTARAAPDRVR
jgi:hypothetical protein